MKKLLLSIILLIFFFQSQVLADAPIYGQSSFGCEYFNEDIEATTDTITTAQCRGTIINNYGQAGNVVLTLPAAKEGYHIIFILGTTVASYFRIDPNGSDAIYLDGVKDTDGHYVGVASAVAGNSIQFIAFQDGANEWNWAAYTLSGPWVAE